MHEAQVLVCRIASRTRPKKKKKKNEKKIIEEKRIVSSAISSQTMSTMTITISCFEFDREKNTEN